MLLSLGAPKFKSSAARFAVHITHFSFNVSPGAPLGKGSFGAPLCKNH